MCIHCQMGKVEDEEHFLIECPKYITQRQELFKQAMHNCINFDNLSPHHKFIWLLSNENETIIESLGHTLLYAK